MSESNVHWTDFRPTQALAQKHEIELHGERGVYQALEDLADQLRYVQRSLWGLAASILIATITFALLQ